MQEMCTYLIEVQGQANEQDVTTMGPHQISVVRADVAVTLFTISTDQAGLIGVIRHIHGKGFVILSVTRQQ
jgi:hypothetical protein